jgi:hypothetical protein
VGARTERRGDGAMRVLIWASTLQADVLALALHLDRRPGCGLLVAAEGLAGYLREPIARARPLQALTIDRRTKEVGKIVSAYRPHVVVCDNHFPEFEAAPRVCLMWHGLGWKATPRGDVRVRLGHVRRLTGLDPRRANPRFLAQCYGGPDLEWRTRRWGIDAGSCAVTGSCFADLIGDPPYTREALAPVYRIDVAARRTLLVNFTWHHGGLFPGRAMPRDREIAFFRAVLARASDHGANALVCLHDRRRYDAAFLAALHGAAARFPHVELKHKDERPDNLADLLVADAMVTNLSSFVTFFYRSGRPSVHLCPPEGDGARMMRLTRLGPRPRRAEGPTAWMNAPEDNGGLTARDPAAALAAIDRALSEPSCCRERSRAWLARHVSDPEGGASARLADALERLVEA